MTCAHTHAMWKIGIIPGRDAERHRFICRWVGRGSQTVIGLPSDHRFYGVVWAMSIGLLGSTSSVCPSVWDITAWKPPTTLSFTLSPCRQISFSPRLLPRVLPPFVLRPAIKACASWNGLAYCQASSVDFKVMSLFLYLDNLVTDWNVCPETSCS